MPVWARSTAIRLHLSSIRGSGAVESCHQHHRIARVSRNYARRQRSSAEQDENCNLDRSWLTRTCNIVSSFNGARRRSFHKLWGQDTSQRAISRLHIPTCLCFGCFLPTTGECVSSAIPPGSHQATPRSSQVFASSASVCLPSCLACLSSRLQYLVGTALVGIVNGRICWTGGERARIQDGFKPHHHDDCSAARTPRVPIESTIYFQLYYYVLHSAVCHYYYYSHGLALLA